MAHKATDPEQKRPEHEPERRRGPFAGYSDEPQPLGSYAALAATLNAAFIAGLLTAHRRGRLPEQLDVRQIVLLGLATHKLARLLSKDAVTSFIRAPFVHLEEKTGSDSLHETARGTGMQHALGELLSCPECTGQWIASGLIIGSLHAPRVTRVITSLYATLAIGDTLQFVYAGLKRRA